MAWYRRTLLWSAGLTVLLVATALVSAAVGPVSLDLLTVAKASVNAIGLPTGLSVTVARGQLLGLSVPVPVLDLAYTYPFALDVPRTAQVIVAQLRLPRIALAAVVGFSLASAGVGGQAGESGVSSRAGKYGRKTPLASAGVGGQAGESGYSACSGDGGAGFSSR